jgi:hypothetical protein
MFWNILLLLFFIVRPMALADDVSVVWSTGASEAKLGQQFDMNVKVSSTAGGTYFVRADDGSDCSLEILYKDPGYWTDSCNIGVDQMPKVVVSANSTAEITLRLRVKGDKTAKSYTLYSYAYDSARTKLGTSLAKSITVNSAPTSTPTPNTTNTPTPTPTIKTTPTPTEAPIMEPTQSLGDMMSPSPVPISLTIDESNKDSKKSGVPLPLIFILFGLLMFIVPVFGPKIVEIIKSKKQTME